MLTVDRLRECLDYDPSTGTFTWKIDVCNMKVGEIAGGPAGGDDYEHPYWRISLDKHSYYAHRLAWFYVYGIWPKPLDHKDTNKLNNAIDNLREATTKQNGANTNSRKNNELGLKGVRKSKRNLSKPYSTRIAFGDKKINLGYFTTAEEAHQAYLDAAKAHYGEFARG